MKIKKVQLRNGYKRFFDLTIDLGDSPAKIVALIGPNGCGKSSVLDGLLFQANPWGQIGNKRAKDFEYHSMNRTPGFNHTNVLVTFTDGSYDEVRAKKAALGRAQTIFSFRSPYRYNSQLKVSESKAMSDIVHNSYGATTLSDLDDKMEENYRRLNIKYNKYLNDVDCQPSVAKAKIIGDLNSSLKKCLDLEISSIGNVESSQGTLYFKKTDHPATFEFDVLSSGEKEVVDILLDLYLRKDEYHDTIFLLDEPELHINTSIQKKLLIEINQLIGENCQLWLTTHSMGFLRALQDDLKDDCQIIQFSGITNLASTPQRLTPMRKTAGKWREIFEVALDDLTHLVSPKRIIYCEGRDLPSVRGDERGLDAKVFNEIFNEKYHDTLFVSSGGNTELDQRSDIAIAILSKVFVAIEILVLKDRDVSSGKPTTLEERERYLNLNPKNHRMLKRWEIENYLFDRQVLEAYCLSQGLAFNAVKYSELVNDVENQNLKDIAGQIKSLCGITTSVNAERFKLALSTFLKEDMPIFRELEGCIFNISQVT
jgi:predicted ATPase